MDLRPELTPPPVSRQRLEELCAEVEQIADLLDAHPEAAGKVIAAFNATTGHDYDALDFAEYDGSRSLEELTRDAARPATELDWVMSGHWPDSCGSVPVVLAG